MTALYDAVAEVAGRDPGRLAVVAPDGTKVGYAQLVRRADRIAGGLQAAGVGPGTTVACSLSNSPDYVALILAVARLGARYVPLLANFDDSDVETALRRTAPVLIVADGRRALPPAPIPVARLDELDAEPSARIPAEPGVFRFLWSSGSTGFPKMIAWRQDKFVAERRRWNADTGITAGDLFLCRHPLDVAHATDLHVFAALLAGAAVALTDAGATPAEVLRRLTELRVTVMSALPDHYADLCDACPPGGVDLSALRRPLCGGSYLSPETIRRCAATLGIRIRQIYGSTEFGLALGDTAETAHEDGRMRVVAGVRARLEPLAATPSGVGELVLLSDCTSEGYVGSSEQNRRTFRTPEFWTGDVATLLPGGRYRVLGRRTDALAGAGGLVLAPAIDEALAAVPAIHASATLPAHPGEYRAEVLVAVEVTGAATAETAVAAVHGVLAAHGLRGEVRPVDALPRTPVGKADKPEIRRLFATVGAVR